MSTATASRNWRRKQKKLGLCLDCNQEATPGTARCAWHHEKNRASVHAHYWRRRRRENEGE